MSALALGLASAGSSLLSLIRPAIGPILWASDSIELYGLSGPPETLSRLAAILGVTLAFFLLYREGTRKWVAAGLLGIAAAFGLVVVSSDAWTYNAIELIAKLCLSVISIACFVIINEFVTESRRGTANMLLYLTLGIFTALASFGGVWLFSGLDGAAAARQLLLLVCLLFLATGGTFLRLSKRPFNLLIANQYLLNPKRIEAKASLISNPRIMIAFLAIAFAAVLATFQAVYLSLWLSSVSIEAGIETSDALAQTSFVFGRQSIVSIGSLIFFGLLLSRLNRLLLLMFPLFILTSSGVFLGFADDPFDPVADVLLITFAAGSGGVLVIAKTLLLQEVPKGRMARTIALSILISSFLSWLSILIGGELFDRFGGAAPFLFCSLVSAVLFAWGIWVYRRSPGPSASEFRSPTYRRTQTD